MFCLHCGKPLPEGARTCPACGQAVASVPAQPASPVAVAPAAPSTPAAIAPPVTSGKAVASLVLGLLSLTILAAIPAVVFGHLALSDIKKSAGRLKGRGLAIAGLVLGYCSIAFIPFILIIAAIAIPNLLRARMAANESSALSLVRTINTAEIAYQTARQTYTCSLPDLAAAGLIDAELASGSKYGYVFVLQGCSQGAGGPGTKYQLTASPMKANQTGTRAFCSDESAVIRADPAGSAQACLENGSPLE